MQQDEVKFHTDRALSELDLAARAFDFQSAQAHLARSEEHLAALKRLCAPCPAERSRR